MRVLLLQPPCHNVSYVINQQIITDFMVNGQKLPGKLKRYLRELIFRKRVKENFTIISNNCWGALIYQELGLQYNTPFIGLSVFPHCYLRLLQNVRGYLESPLTFIETSRYGFVNEGRKNGQGSFYPIGCLGGDIEIHFMHYSSESEAREKWNRRKSRINWDSERIFVKFCDNPPIEDGMNICGEELIVEFDKLYFAHKVCFTGKKYPNIKSNVWIKECEKKSYVMNGVSLYRICRKYFDLADWLNGGEGRIGTTQSLLNTILYYQRGI